MFIETLLSRRLRGFINKFIQQSLCIKGLIKVEAAVKNPCSLIKEIKKNKDESFQEYQNYLKFHANYTYKHL